MSHLLYSVEPEVAHVFYDSGQPCLYLPYSLRQDLNSYRLVASRSDRFTVLTNMLGFVDAPLKVYKPIERALVNRPLILHRLESNELETLVELVCEYMSFLDECYDKEDNVLYANLIYRIETLLPPIEAYIKWHTDVPL